MYFKDRNDAGKQLAKKLKKYKDSKNTIVIALPRGGVVNAYEVAHDLNLNLDIIVSKKISSPYNKEYAIGAINADGDVLLNPLEEVDQTYIETQKKEILNKIKEKEKKLRGNKAPLNLKDKTVILIDDGIATGYTVKAAIKYLKKRNVKKIILAVPVCPKDTVKEFSKLVDEFICLYSPLFFGAIGSFYENFQQVSDEEAKLYLEKIGDNKN